MEVNFTSMEDYIKKNSSIRTEDLYENRDKLDFINCKENISREDFEGKLKEKYSKQSENLRLYYKNQLGGECIWEDRIKVNGETKSGKNHTQLSLGLSLVLIILGIFSGLISSFVLYKNINSTETYFVLVFVQVLLSIILILFGLIGILKYKTD